MKNTAIMQFTQTHFTEHIDFQVTGQKFCFITILDTNKLS